MTGTAGHERADAPPKWVALGLVGLLSLIALGALVALGVGAAFDRRHPASALTDFDIAAATPPTPRLEVDARADRLALEARAEAHLDDYGWTDGAASMARIPIDRAMALQAAQGWPDAATNAAAPAPSNSPTPPPAGAAEPSP